MGVERRGPILEPLRKCDPRTWAEVGVGGKQDRARKGVLPGLWLGCWGGGQPCQSQAKGEAALKPRRRISPGYTFNLWTVGVQGGVIHLDVELAGGPGWSASLGDLSG